MKFLATLIAVCFAAALSLPQAAIASLAINNLNIEFYSLGIYNITGGSGGACDDGITATAVEQDTVAQTIDATSGYTFGSGDLIADCYFLTGDGMSISGDTLTIQVGDAAWGPMTIRVSGWSDTLTDVIVNGDSAHVNDGSNGVSLDTLTASYWEAQLGYDAGSTNTFQFVFDDSGSGTGNPPNVPLPATGLLLLGGLGGIAALKRRRGK